MRNEIIELAVKLAKGEQTQYSKNESELVLRKALADILEIEDVTKGFEVTRQQFRKHKVEIFEIIEEILNEVIHEGLAGQFDQFADYRNLKWGDKNVFYVPANHIYRVALVSDGNSNIRRQRLKDGQEFSVNLDTYAIKIGEDLHRFLAGRVEWSNLFEGIARSFADDLNERIHTAVMASYGKYGATYHNTFTSGSLTEEDLITMAMHIEARTGEQVAIYGTKLALRKIAPEAISEAMKDGKNEIGYFANVAGIPLREIKQSHKVGTDEFAIDNNFVLMLPESVDKMVKVVNEGDAIIQDGQGSMNADMMEEYFVANKFGIAVITSKAFGFIKF